jgi:choline-sulfatase
MFSVIRKLLFPLIVSALFIAAGEAKPGIVLITIDTLRADHLGCYGYKQNTSPAIDLFSKQALVFQNAFSAVPLTLPSHVTILSGLYPKAHGVRDNAHFAIKTSNLIPQILKQNGYCTAAFVSGSPLSASFGLNRGFDIYDDNFAGAERKANETTDRVLHWLNSAKSSFFLWVHYFDPHAEYEPPAQFRKKFREPYDGEVAFVDSELSRLFKQISNDTAVIIAADHGESFGEHGETTHAVFLYNATLHVPLMLKIPGTKPAIRTDAVSLADIAPTILTLAGIKSVPMDGVSLLKESPDRTLIAESLYAQRNYGYAPLFASIKQQKKFIEAPQREFYDLPSDPKELHNLIQKSKVDQWAKPLREYSKDYLQKPQASLPPEEEEKLRSLGYVSGGVAQTGADPKEKIQIMERFRLGMVMLKKEQYSQAETRFREIASTEQHNGLAFRFLGDALAAQHKYAEAAKAYSDSLHRLPDPEVAVQLAKAHNRLQQTAQAEKVLQQAIHDFPHAVEPAFELASLYTAQRNWNQALAILNRDQPEFHNQRGLVYLTQKDAQTAATEFQKAISMQERATYSNNLGIALQQLGQLNEAEKAYLRGLQLDPAYAECEANLAFLLISLRRWEEASEHLERIASANSKLWRARMALGYVREKQGREPEALEIYKRLLAEAPSNWPERGQLESRVKQLVIK